MTWILLTKYKPTKYYLKRTPKKPATKKKKKKRQNDTHRQERILHLTGLRHSNSNTDTSVCHKLFFLLPDLYFLQQKSYNDKTKRSLAGILQDVYGNKLFQMQRT